jgi:hypothetical protein
LIVLGIIIAALAATGAIAAVADGASHHTTVTLSAFGKALPATSTAGVFLVGAATACVFLLGCSIATTGLRRSIRVRRELRDLRDEHDENLQALVAEKSKLERQLARERRMTGRPQTIPGRQLPDENTAAEPFLEPGPIAGSPGRGVPGRPAFPGHEMPPSTVSAQLYPHLNH